MVAVNFASPNATGRRYWLIVVILVVLGFLTIFSIGLYFWFVAVALTLLSPLRSRPRVFRSGIGLFLGFLVGYALIAPWGCSQSFTSDTTTGEETVSPVVCTSPIGIKYSGTEPFDPSRNPALIVGGISAILSFTVVWRLTGSTNDRPGSGETSESTE